MHLEDLLKSRAQDTLKLRRAVKLVWDSSRVWTIISFALLLIQGVLPLISLYVLKLMLDAITEGLTEPDRDVAFANVTNIIILAGAVTLLSHFFSTLGHLVTTTQARLVADHMNDIIHEKSIAVDLEYYENSEYLDTLHRAQQEAPYRPLRIVNGLSQVLQSAVSLIGTGWLLLSFHWGLALILVVAVLPSMLIRLRFSRLMYHLQRQYTPEDRRSWYFQQLLLGTNYAKEIRIFGLGSTFIQRYGTLRSKLRRIKIRIDIQRSGWEFIAQAVATAAVFGSYLFVAYRTLQGSLTLGDMVMFYQAFQRGQGFLQAFLTNLADLYESNLFITNLYQFLDVQPKVVDPPNPQSIPAVMQTGVNFEDVSFRYPNSQREVLNNINLTIRPGEVIALVGENGSGKTTLVKLLCRLYDPTSGSITLDGIDLQQFKVAALRQQISVIFQDYAHYNLTARDNIWFGNVDIPPDEQRIVSAAQYAGADEVVSRLPGGYDTVLGKLFENGEELSIGQWQKIALARAFLRNSQIIVLDEPTSAMDPKAEYEVFLKFRELLQGRTAILISHRLSTVRMADRIFVLQNGQIVESGTHDELVTGDGIYKHLFETQAQHYL